MFFDLKNSLTDFDLWNEMLSSNNNESTELHDWTCLPKFTGDKRAMIEASNCFFDKHKRGQPELVYDTRRIQQLISSDTLEYDEKWNTSFLPRVSSILKPYKKYTPLVW